MSINEIQNFREGKKSCLLLIDDDASVLESLKMILSPEFETISARTAFDGIEAFRLRKPPMVILDYRLPDDTGVEVLRRILEIDSSACVMILTGYSTNEIAEEAWRLGVREFMTKPFEAWDLRNRVSTLLQEQASNRRTNDDYQDLQTNSAVFIHDAANPLSCLLMLSDHLEARIKEGTLIDPESIAMEVDLLATNVKSLKYLLDQWREFNTGKHANTLISNPRGSIDIATSQVIHRLRSTKIKLQVKVETKTARFSGGYLALAQVLVNLLTNAIEAVSPEDGQVMVLAVNQADAIQILVSDNGCGIPADKLGVVFDRDFTTKTEGRGLGLYSCRRTIELLQGKIEVRSPGCLGGTDFIITLPSV